MRLLVLHVVPLSILLLGVPFVTYAGTTFTSSGVAPYVSGIAVKVNGEFVSPNIKTQHNVTVVISVESFGKNYTIDTPLQSDNYTFTENGQFVFTFHDEDGATGSSTVTVDNIDRTPPVITIGSYATSSTNAPVTVSVSVNEGTLNVESHEFSENGSFDFVATDEAGNIATSTVAITHIDKEAPVITRAGDARVRVRSGEVYVDAGASATDNMDGTVAVVVSGNVDTATDGEYTITYSATDAAGNVAESVTRTVEVFHRSSGGGGRSSRISTPDTQSFVGRVLGASTYNFSSDLTIGAKGIDVSALQDLLRERGFFSEASTGYFGPVTRASVVAFQASQMLPQTGYVGPLTRSALSGNATSMSAQAQIALLTAQLEELKRLFALRQ